MNRRMNVDRGRAKFARNATLLLAFLVGSGEVATTGSAAKSSESNTPSASVYDLRMESDRRLFAFEKQHPNCPMWTDWRKLCSRLGPGGSTYCKTDPVYSAKPSTPFCATEANMQDTKAESDSRMRFCVKYNRRSNDGDVDYPTGSTYCEEYKSLRPFGGQQFAQLEHPACTAWGNGTPTKNVCASGQSNENGLPKCDSPEIRNNPQSEALSCTAWSSTILCNAPIGGVKPTPPSEAGIYLGSTRSLTSRPVWGAYCASTRK